jgi:N-acetylglutamate synthase-like GNAT family acetyltransferase
MNWIPRLAREDDIPALDQLITVSVRSLLAAHYSSAQLDAALGPVFGVDSLLIRDGTFFAVDREGQIIGCGGWSKRKTMYGGDRGRVDEDTGLDPRRDAARVRAFFIHPDWVRRGIGANILAACERAAIAAGFQKVELVATLAGEPLYAKFGYVVMERYDAPMPGGLGLAVVRMTKRL